jgi:hypothetical protein
MHSCMSCRRSSTSSPAVSSYLSTASKITTMPVVAVVLARRPHAAAAQRGANERKLHGLCEEIYSAASYSLEGETITFIAIRGEWRVEIGKAAALMPQLHASHDAVNAVFATTNKRDKVHGMCAIVLHAARIQSRKRGSIELKSSSST